MEESKEDGGGRGRVLKGGGGGGVWRERREKDLKEEVLASC